MARAGLDFQFDPGWIFAAVDDWRVSELVPG
jgi:hypothetical protein